MKVTAYVCSNLEEIEKNREESERLGIDPYDYITPEYQEETTWIHVDDSEWAGVLYLTPGASLNTGTGIFDEEDSLITYVGNVYNRLVLYRGDLFHRSIQPGFGTDISTGRLTQVLFFNISL